MAKIISQSKKCVNCGEEKSISHFHKFNRRGRVEARSSCIDCERNTGRTRLTKEQAKAKNRKYYSANKEKENDRSERYRKSHMEKARLQAVKNRERHPERKKFWDKRWARNNREKLRIIFHVRKSRIKGNGGKISEKEWRDLCEKYGNRCINPRCPDPSKPVTLDHIIPIALGGINVIENAQPLCKSCNSRKHTKIIDYRIFYD